MQGYIIDIKPVKDDDLIVSILTENELLTTYRFYGARHSNINIGYKIDFELIDAGGGLGIPYSNREPFLDTEKPGNSLNELINKPEYKNFLSGIKIILEPGRFLSGLSGIYLMKVLYKKESVGKKILLTDGGIHHLLRPALIGQEHPVINLTSISKGTFETEEYMVAGPLCTSLDQFGNSIFLSKPEPGDILAVLNAIRALFVKNL